MQPDGNTHIMRMRNRIYTLSQPMDCALTWSSFPMRENFLQLVRVVVIFTMATTEQTICTQAENIDKHGKIVSHIAIRAQYQQVYSIQYRVCTSVRAPQGNPIIRKSLPIEQWRGTGRGHEANNRDAESNGGPGGQQGEGPKSNKGGAQKPTT